MIGAAKKIVGNLICSPLLYMKLHQVQQQESKTTIKLVQVVSTGWNSTFMTIERPITQTAMTTALENDKANLNMTRTQFWPGM